MEKNVFCFQDTIQASCLRDHEYRSCLRDHEYRSSLIHQLDFF